jgi:hypothetical protein
VAVCGNSWRSQFLATDKQDRPAINELITLKLRKHFALEFILSRDWYTVFGLVIGFNEHVLIVTVTVSRNYTLERLLCSHTTHKAFSVYYSSRCLVTDSNHAFCFRAHNLTSNSLLGMDHTENTVLLFPCQHDSLLLLPRSLPSNGSTCYNIITNL